MSNIERAITEKIRATFDFPTHRPPVNTEELKRIYDYIYRHEIPKQFPYGSHTNRDPRFVECLSEILPVIKDLPAPRVLDASCGRGHLARTLKNMGYDVEATEISRYLVNEELPNTIQGIPIHLLAYDEFDQLPEKSFDVVISNDVMEHLPNEKAVRIALRNLSNISKRYVIFSIGLKRAMRYPKALKFGYGYDLHLFVPTRKTWMELLNRYFTTTKYADLRNSIFFCGKVKG